MDSATATASALAELLSVNGLEAPGRRDGTAARDAIASSRPGTSDAVRAIWPGALFGTAFPDVESVELGVLAG